MTVPTVINLSKLANVSEIDQIQNTDVRFVVDRTPQEVFDSMSVNASVVSIEAVFTRLLENGYNVIVDDTDRDFYFFYRLTLWRKYCQKLYQDGDLQPGLKLSKKTIVKQLSSKKVLNSICRLVSGEQIEQSEIKVVKPILGERLYQLLVVTTPNAYPSDENGKNQFHLHGHRCAGGVSGKTEVESAPSISVSQQMSALEKIIVSLVDNDNDEWLRLLVMVLQPSNHNLRSMEYDEFFNVFILYDNDEKLRMIQGALYSYIAMLQILDGDVEKRVIENFHFKKEWYDELKQYVNRNSFFEFSRNIIHSIGLYQIGWNDSDKIEFHLSKAMTGLPMSLDASYVSNNRVWNIVINTPFAVKNDGANKDVLYSYCVQFSPSACKVLSYVRYKAKLDVGDDKEYYRSLLSRELIIARDVNENMQLPDILTIADSDTFVISIKKSRELRGIFVLHDSIAVIPTESQNALLDFVRAVVGGIEKLRVKGYTHGDLKIENIVRHSDSKVTGDDNYSLIDFGSVRKCSDETADSCVSTVTVLSPNEWIRWLISGDVSALSGFIDYQVYSYREPWCGLDTLFREFPGIKYKEVEQTVWSSRDHFFEVSWPQVKNQYRDFAKERGSVNSGETKWYQKLLLMMMASKKNDVDMPMMEYFQMMVPGEQGGVIRLVQSMFKNFFQCEFSKKNHAISAWIYPDTQDDIYALGAMLYGCYHSKSRDHSVNKPVYVFIKALYEMMTDVDFGKRCGVAAILQKCDERFGSIESEAGAGEVSSVVVSALGKRKAGC